MDLGEWLIYKMDVSSFQNTHGRKHVHYTVLGSGEAVKLFHLGYAYTNLDKSENGVFT